MQKQNIKVRVFQHRGIYHAEFSGGVRRSLKSRDKDEAMKTLDEVIRQLNFKMAEKTAPGKPTRLEDFKKDYERSRVGISKWTVKKDLLSLKLLIEAVGNIWIADLDSNEIDSFKVTCIARGATPQTVNGYLRHIKAALHFAFDRELIAKIPKIKMLPERKMDMVKRVISPTDLKLLLDTATADDSMFGTYLTVLAWTGCRRREILGLEWSNIDFKVGTIDVVGKGMRERRIPMLASVKAVLEPIKKVGGSIFPPWHPDTVSKWFLALARFCGVQARLHDLRHTAATYLLKGGASLPAVKKILGHSNVGTTMIYAHVLDDLLAKEMAKLTFE